MIPWMYCRIENCFPNTLFSCIKTVRRLMNRWFSYPELPEKSSYVVSYDIKCFSKLWVSDHYI